MNQEWQSFLSEQNAIFESNDMIVSADLDNTCQKMDLSYLGIIKISGDDKQTFLQGQLTSDTREINANNSQLSSFCTPKGRILASFRIFQSDDDWFLILPKQRLEPILKRLKMFVLMSKVTLEDVSDDFICIGLTGECIEENVKVPLPTTVNNVTQTDGNSFVLIDDKKTRFLVMGNFASISTLWNKCDNAAIVNASNWRLYDIQAGIPSIVDETSEAFIPQMLNLQLLDAVSFTKGCYTGQEIVARMQYLGKVKRRMYPVSFKSSLKPKAGDMVFSSTSQSGQGAGKLVDVIEVSKDQYEGLSVIEIKSIEDETLRLYNDEGPLLKVEQSPYSFEIEEN